jgi:hypothetical protein
MIDGSRRKSHGARQKARGSRLQLKTAGNRVRGSGIGKNGKSRSGHGDAVSTLTKIQRDTGMGH